MTSSKDLNTLIIEGIHERKGRGVTVVDMSAIESAAAQYFIIAEGASTTQTESIAESVHEYVRTNGGVKPFTVDVDTPDWVILDYGQTWVHIFLPETRRRYSLEELWSDAVVTEIADLD